MQSSTVLMWAAAALVLPAALLAQDSAKKPAKNEAVTLTGCMSASPLSSGDFTFVDGTTGSKYRLTGKGLRNFAGQQVEIVSSPSKSLTIKGGLYPSPNIAAQAGALDPAQEAIARQPGGAATGTGGDAALPEFRVARVKATSGTCQ
jgi:hypothetical protein